MDGSRSRRIVVAGAGIAGLTAALCFAAKGFAVSVHERAPGLEEAGAGIQLSPNATRILARLGVLADLGPAAARPEAVVLKKAANLKTLARVPLGSAAEDRWRAPYLVVHRADLAAALAARVEQKREITLATGSAVRDAAFHARGVRVSLDRDGTVEETGGVLLVAADGVWSRLRRKIAGATASRFSGHVAWRATLDADDPAGEALREVAAADNVTAFLHRRFHLLAYPLRGGAATNLVAVTRGVTPGQGWSRTADTEPLASAMRTAAPTLAALPGIAAPWTAWPIHTAGIRTPWTHPGGLALVGDAAHAMTPFAAQGAAMAIEDAAVLADMFVKSPEDLTGALTRYEAARRPRVARVARRGAFNRFAWHAAGPVALARDLVLRTRAPERLMHDLDWLYGWDGASPEV